MCRIVHRNSCVTTPSISINVKVLLLHFYLKLVLRKGSAAAEQQDKEDKKQGAKIASRRNDKARAKHVPASPLAGRLRGYARS